MTTIDQLMNAYSQAAWSMKPRDGIRKLKTIRAVTREERELKWCYLGFMYDHLANPHWPGIRREMEAAARHAYRQALRLNPNCTTAMIGLGRILVNREDVRALKWYRKAFQVDPKEPKVEFSLAYACSQLDQWKEAIDRFKRLRRYKALRFACVFNLAQLHARRGKKKLAQHYAKIALKLFPSLPKKERESRGGAAFKAAMTDLAHLREQRLI
jgi:tetratricopeptide (TPR) repeat protein